jgi:ABC-type uncharacterized transport system ATPase subunit
LETFDLVSDRVSRFRRLFKKQAVEDFAGFCLASQPELILLDEPLTGLDVNSPRLVKDRLATLAGWQNDSS